MYNITPVDLQVNCAMVFIVCGYYTKSDPEGYGYSN